MERFTNKNWILNNFFGFALAYLVYSPIAHGLTGGHDSELTYAQILSHTLALITVGGVIGYFQFSYLKKFLLINPGNIVIMPFFFVIAFWLGWFTIGAPVDIILSFPVLGSVLWIFNPRMENLNQKYRILAYTSFLIGTLGSMIVAYPISEGTNLLTMVEGEVYQHGIGWFIMAVPAGTLGAYISGLAIDRAINHGGKSG